MGHGKGMNNHQYSPDKAQVIKDESPEAELGPRGGFEMDITLGTRGHLPGRQMVGLC